MLGVKIERATGLAKSTPTNIRNQNRGQFGGLSSASAGEKLEQRTA